MSEGPFDEINEQLKNARNAKLKDPVLRKIYKEMYKEQMKQAKTVEEKEIVKKSYNWLNM